MEKIPPLTTSTGRSLHMKSTSLCGCAECDFDTRQHHQSQSEGFRNDCGHRNSHHGHVILVLTWWFVKLCFVETRTRECGGFKCALIELLLCRRKYILSET